jgi:hypothetical protein
MPYTALPRGHDRLGSGVLNSHEIHRLVCARQIVHGDFKRLVHHTIDRPRIHRRTTLNNPKSGTLVQQKRSFAVRLTGCLQGPSARGSHPPRRLAFGTVVDFKQQDR